MITLLSFGFKYRRPPANNYIDVSFIKNPAREKKWGLFSKIDKEMIDFVLNHNTLDEILNKTFELIIFLKEQDDDLRFAFGCSAGRHRSPIFVKLLEKKFMDSKIAVKVKHLELEGD
jgi:RNase adaptor protein for sRNA GlmZ degradation